MVKVEVWGAVITKGDMKIENVCEGVLTILTMKFELHEKRS